MSGPMFVHDCEDCIFLGHLEGCDLYYCPRCDGGTAICRYGSDGPLYASAPHSVIKRWGFTTELSKKACLLVVAYLITKSRGFDQAIRRTAHERVCH